MLGAGSEPETDDMAYESLRDFIERLESAGRLVRVSAPVSPRLEITEIHTRLLAERGPAVLFENVEGSTMPVLANLFGTVERVAWGMSREPHELRQLGELLAFLRQPEPPGGWREAVGMVPLLRAALAMKPTHRVARGLPGGGAAGRRRSTSACCRSRPAGRASPRR